MQHELTTLEIALSLIISIFAALLAFVTFLYSRKHNVQTRKLSDFVTVANSIGTEDIVKQRNEIYQESEKIQELINKFKKEKYNPELSDLHNKIWYVYTVYNRVCFILSDSNEKEFREHFIKFHGPTLCKLFIILHGLIKTWAKRQGAMNYPFLQQIVMEIKSNHPEMWDYVLRSIRSDQDIKVYDEEGNEIERDNVKDIELDIIEKSNYNKSNS